MPLVRSVIKVGDSRAVVIPADWLKYYEGKRGKPIESLLMEVNNIITLRVEDDDESAQPKTKSDL